MNKRELILYIAVPFCVVIFLIVYYWLL